MPAELALDRTPALPSKNATSRRPQVPLEVELRDLGIKSVLLGALDGTVDLHEARAEIILEERRTFRAAEGGVPVAGQTCGRLLVAIALDGRAGIEPFDDAAVRAREHRRRGEIGIGIGACHAVLDVAGVRRTGRHAQTDGAVVDAPA